MKMIIAQRSAGCTKSMMIIMMQKLWVKRILRNDTKSHHSTVPPIPVQTPNLYLRICQLDDEEAESVTVVKKCFFFSRRKTAFPKSQPVQWIEGKREKFCQRTQCLLQANSHQTRPPVPTFTGANLCLRVCPIRGKMGMQKA